jgi:nicotinamide mononucleotide transporter
MAIVGWISWKKSEADKSSVIKWEMKSHLINIFLSGSLAFVLGYVFDNYTNQANPYVDAFTTCFSLSATFMVTKKILENWIYWIVIDLVSIYLYAQRDYNLSAIQYGLFTILAVFGFMAWQKEYKTQMA